MSSNITISAKVAPEINEQILATGYSISDVMQVSVELFLNLPVDEQKNLMWKHFRRKKVERAMERYMSFNGEEGRLEK